MYKPKTCWWRRICDSVLFAQITMEAMKSEIDEISLQGIEFWSNVCDEEMDLAIEASEVKIIVQVWFLFHKPFGQQFFFLNWAFKI